MAGTTAVRAGAAVPLGHQEAMILAAAEFDRMAAQLEALAPRDWAQPTVCEVPF
jgi:phage tail tape-measure protein